MREVRFRAWAQDQMWQFIELTSYKDGSLGIGVGNGYHDLRTPKHGVELMQFTGLKDKNGVEIYEGDIVKWYNYAREKGCQKCGTHESGDRNHSIVWNKNGWSHTTEDGETYPLDISDTKCIEVIGNIHENPELLTDKPQS